jgi:hypothetical protein
MVFLKLRSAPSGPAFVGEDDGDTLLWSEERQAFSVGPLPANAVLSSVFVVDRGTSVPAAKQTGSYGAPFASVQDALDAAAASSATAVAVLVAPGFYQAEGALTFEAAKSLTIAALVPGFGGDAPAVGIIVYEGPELVLSGMVHGGLQVTGDAKLLGCKTGAIDTIMNVSGALEVNECTWLAGAEAAADTMLIRSSDLDDVTLEPADANGCTILATELTTEAVVTFGAGPGSLRLDSLSWYSWQAISGTVNNGSVVGLTPTE